MARNGMDGWLMYDYGHRNPYIPFVIGPNRPMVKKYYVFIPLEGAPESFVTYTGMFKPKNGQIKLVTYKNDDDLAYKLKERLKGLKNIAMEFSPNNYIPRIDVVPKGVADFLEKEIGLHLVDSVDLAQYATAYSHEQIQMLRQANTILNRVHKDAYKFIANKIRNNKKVTEYDVQQYILTRQEEMNLANPVHIFPPFVGKELPAVAVNELANDFYYSPSAGNHREIKKGDVIVMDFTGKLDDPDAPYADVTTTGYVGTNVPEKLHWMFELLLKARNGTIQFLHDRVGAQKYPQGWEIDAVARRIISDAGYGERFTHRAGHDLGIFSPWGERANIDSLSKETRRLTPGSGFALETGLYFPNEYGMRTEVNITIDVDGTVEVDELMQTEIEKI